MKTNLKELHRSLSEILFVEQGHYALQETIP